MARRLISIAVWMLIGGCTVFQSGLEMTNAMAEPATKVAPNELAAIRAGSRIAVLNETSHSMQRYVGTVLQSSPDGIALVNCVQEGRTFAKPVATKNPFTARLFKNSGVGRQKVPVQWVSIQKITSFTVIAPPPADYIAPQLDIDTSDEMYFERIGIDFDFNIPSGANSPGKVILLP